MKMNNNMKGIACLTLCSLFICFGTSAAKPDNPKLSPTEELGRFLYFDTNLSEPAGQSCASCHDPDFGFVDPDSNLPVSEGVIPGLFGGRNSPSSAYAMYAPMLYFDEVEGLWIGGQFWDARATGEVLGDPLADQALGPFLNPVEMANPSKKHVIDDIKISEYASLFEEVWGEGSLDDVEAAYDQVALSIAAFERTALFAPFSSKYDAYLQSCLKKGGAKDECAMGIGPQAANAAAKIFTTQEWDGLQLFMGDNNNDGILTEGEGAMCAACHIAEWTDPILHPETGEINVVIPTWSPDGTVPPVFTDFTYDNLGVAKNTEYPLPQTGPPDSGLGPIVHDPKENGKFKVMTLRNIELTGPYAHNGLFKSLKEITHFYNTRGLQPDASGEFGSPEFPATMNTTELGNLGLSDADENALVEFMKTLTDGYK
ncbi:cytochrome-c peroxidase [Desulfosediminicola ganghwensis]|uniref:cytochrome-c peroxidase n=1 Tax=Desulfosediminicola ganghwensis TaxID=2569540 RepID=UPI0010ACD4B7|nr:cytochrome c peroxidase [Desulfosediminicola ganghwensis]